MRVLSLVNWPRSKISSTMGPDSAMRPMVAGTLNISIIRMLLDTVRRTSPIAPAFTCRAISGMAAVATDTPKRPMGRYIRRNASCSAVTAPSPSPTAR